MSRETFVYRDGQMIPKAAVFVAPVARSELPCPMIIRDGMDAIINPANGMYYESKSSFEKATRAAGCVCVGNDAPTTPADPIGDRISKDEIGEAIQKVRQGYKPTLTNEPAEIDFANEAL